MWSRTRCSFAEFVGGGRSSISNGCDTTALVRFFSRKRAENLRKINPKVTPQEASSIAQDLYGLLRQQGPLSVSNAWIQAQENRIEGLKSKTHMKLMLKWMRGRKMLKLLCNRIGSTKKFLLSTLPDEPNTGTECSTNSVELKTEKPPIKKTEKPPIKRRKQSK